jgi:hypothetical protein
MDGPTVLESTSVVLAPNACHVCWGVRCWCWWHVGERGHGCMDGATVLESTSVVLAPNACHVCWGVRCWCWWNVGERGHGGLGACRHATRVEKNGVFL